jgi:hypothetical protein
MAYLRCSGHSRDAVGTGDHVWTTPAAAEVQPSGNSKADADAESTGHF